MKLLIIFPKNLFFTFFLILLNKNIIIFKKSIILTYSIKAFFINGYYFNERQYIITQLLKKRNLILKINYKNIKIITYNNRIFFNILK